MLSFYINLLSERRITIDQVPTLWRKKVITRLNEDALMNPAYRAILDDINASEQYKEGDDEIPEEEIEEYINSLYNEDTTDLDDGKEKEVLE